MLCDHIEEAALPHSILVEDKMKSPSAVWATDRHRTSSQKIILPVVFSVVVGGPQTATRETNWSRPATKRPIGSRTDL